MFPFCPDIDFCAEHVDLPLLAKRGVKLGYTPDVLTDAGKRKTSAVELFTRT